MVLLQESNGFPGAESSSPLSLQQVAIAGDRVRVLDPGHGWALFIDLAERKVREASVPSKEYVERDFRHYERYREKRARNLAAQAEEWLRLKERLEERGDAERLRAHVEEYRRLGGDPEHPGRIVARLEHRAQDRRKRSVRVGRERREVVVEHYLIRENQAKQPVFDLWVTEELQLPVDVLRYYRELGTFSPEVTAKLQEVPGTILECVARLDTGTLRRSFRSRVLEVRAGEPVAGSMTVPAGWTRRQPEERGAERAGAGPAGPRAQRRCAVCGAPLGGKGLSYRNPITRRLLFACSKKHRIELIRRASAELRKRRGK
ncbi:MAG: hypothetical protein D6731_22530 [Planctomycetota bacterium]|nr:MAG: hypothetical protein D6731_22530 [Planctomycetota bacterium]